MRPGGSLPRFQDLRAAAIRRAVSISARLMLTRFGRSLCGQGPSDLGASLAHGGLDRHYPYHILSLHLVFPRVSDCMKRFSQSMTCGRCLARTYHLGPLRPRRWAPWGSWPPPGSPAFASCVFASRAALRFAPGSKQNVSKFAIRRSLAPHGRPGRRHWVHGGDGGDANGPEDWQ